MWYLNTMEFYSAIKKNEILSFASKWVELEKNDVFSAPTNCPFYTLHLALRVLAPLSPLLYVSLFFFFFFFGGTGVELRAFTLARQDLYFLSCIGYF
jgi:hypothetical protein